MQPYLTHLQKVRDAMRRWGADLLVLNYGPDLTYISGIVSPPYYPILKGQGDWITLLLVPLEGDPILLLQKSFAVNIEEQTWLNDIRILPDDEEPNRFLAQMLSELDSSIRRVAIGKMLWAQSLLALQEALPEAEFFSATHDMMDEVRVVKDDDEIALMSRAAEITDQAMEATVRQMRIGMTEADVSAEVSYQIRRHGGDGDSFTPGIICVGNGSDPDRHIFTRNTEMVLASGTTVAFDFGVLYRGYCSDFGRSVFMGDPREDALDAYRSITRLCQDSVEVMVDGSMTPAQVADWARDRVEADGFGQWYMYLGLGHSIGLEVHESPWLRPEFQEPLRTNMCFTVEPKVWKPGLFYVRCEDVVVVGSERGRLLTRAPYEPYFVTS